MAVRVGFIGSGGMAANHMRNMRQNEHVEMVSVCDVVRERAEQAAQTYGMKAYTDYVEMLDNERLDAVFVCVPPFAHGEIEETAAARGIHLFVEKPVELDVAAARRKAEAIEQAGIITSSGYALRYVGSVEQARKYLQDKTIGMVRAYYLSGFVKNPWWRVKEKSGGQLVEQATHVVDFARYLAGDVVKVYADMELRHLHDIENLNIADVTSVQLRFKSGAIGHVETCCIQPDHRYGVEIRGRDFRVVYEGTTLTIIEKDRNVSVPNEVPNIFQAQDNTFIRAILENDPSLVRSSYRDALKTLEVTVAANQSAASGQPVYLES
jgi:predicted dehydrogenase